MALDAKIPSLRDKLRDQALQAEREAKELERVALEDAEEEVSEVKKGKSVKK